MAKIKCPICGNEINSTDTKCINCGSDNKTIQFELKKRELLIEGKIKDENVKKKSIIIAIEVTLILLAIVLYYILFLPKVVNEIKINGDIEREKNCTKESGNWNADLNECILSE